MKRVVITGGNGFVGRFVTDSFRKAGYEIVIVDRMGHEQNYDQIQYIQLDLSTDGFINCVSKISNADVLIHLASDISVPGDAGTIGNNLYGTYAALEIARFVRVQHFVYLSSVPVIGDIEYTPIDEEHRVHPKTPYHWSKFLGEQMIYSYREYFDVTTVFRIPSPIGKGMRRDNFLSNIIRKAKDSHDIELYGRGERIQNYIDVRDIARAILMAVEANSEGLYLIAGKKSYSNRDVVNLCIELTGSESKVTEGLRPDPAEGEKWLISTKKAADSFGYAPRYEISDTVKWVLEDEK